VYTYVWWRTHTEPRLLMELSTILLAKWPCVDKAADLVWRCTRGEGLRWPRRCQFRGAHSGWPGHWHWQLEPQANLKAQAASDSECPGEPRAAGPRRCQ
jgi:hypothetical protein